eukprot:PhF_6_TR19675/c0_g1_i3/m.28729/K03687/GRPE; molecular chaperone GrpE
MFSRYALRAASTRRIQSAAVPSSLSFVMATTTVAQRSFNPSPLYSNTIRWYSTEQQQQTQQQQPPKPDEPAAETANATPKGKIEDSAHQKHQEALAEKDARIKELKDQCLYAMADAENARKVAAEDVRKAKEFGIKDFAKDMLEVVDCLENAVANIGKLPKEEIEKLKNVTTGINMTLSVLFKNLERHGVTKMPLKVGDEFDANFHDALFNHPIKAGENLKPGQVAHIVKTGYRITSRNLRPAQVGVAQENKE